jgi:hypothetical protein
MIDFKKDGRVFVLEYASFCSIFLYSTESVGLNHNEGKYWIITRPKCKSFEDSQDLYLNKKLDWINDKTSDDIVFETLDEAIQFWDKYRDIAWTRLTLK